MKRLLLVFAAALAWAVPSLAQTVITVAEDYDAGITAHEDGAAAWGWTHDPFTLSVNVNGGTSVPVINTGAKDLRVYAKGSLTIEASGCAMTKVVFKISTQGLKRLAPITASEGVIAAQAAGDTEVTWTGDPTSKLTFTVGEKADFGTDGSGKAGQLCVDAIEITSQEGEVADPKKLVGLPVGEIVDGESYYLYNVDFGTWLGDNKSNASEPRPWTSRAELGHHGRDIKFIAKDGGWQLDPKLGNNHSINAGNLYMDTGAGVTVWTISAIEGDDANAVTIKSGDMSLAANDEGKMRAENEVTDNHNKWLIISRAERLRQAAAAAKEDSPVDISGLVLGGTFPVACDHRNGAWQGEKGSNASGGDGFYHCNRVWELWGISNRNIYQDIKGLPNGKYIVNARAIYVSTGNDGQNQDRYNEYVEDPAGNTKGVIYANDVTSSMRNVYEYASDERVNDRFTRDLGNGKWTMQGTNEFSTNMFEGKGEIEPIEVIVTNGNLRVGFKVEGANNAWMLINNIDLAYAGEVKIDLTPYKEALEAAIQSANEMQVEEYAALQTAKGEKLAAILQDAMNILADEDATAGDLETAKTELVDIMNIIKEMSPAVADIQKTSEVCLAEVAKKADKDFSAYLETISDKCYNLESKGAAETLLRQMQNHRKLYAADKVNVSAFQGAEPAEGDFYLLNVGTGLFFNTEADWGTHIAIGNDGMLMHLFADGDNGQPIFKINGNGFNGLNWGEEYWDKNGEHRFHFTPVEGKDKVYYLNVFDNHRWHFVYDVDDDECDGGRRYWNAVQKRERDEAEYKDDLCAQWMLITADEYKAYAASGKLDAPTSATMFINNPNFNYVEPALGGRDRGWNNPGSVMGDNDARHWSVLEWFERDVDMNQTIENLPAGFYKVSVNAFFRDGTTDNEASKAAAGEELKQLASLYAQVGEKVVSVPLPNVTSEAGMLPGWGEANAALEGAFANWPWQARHFFESGLYSATTGIIKVSEGETLTIGLSMENDGTPGNWVVADNFRLEYVGESLGLPESMAIRSHGKWDGVAMKKADDSDDLCAHFTASDYFVNDVQQEGIFINFKNGDDWYCPASGENVVVPAGEEVTEIVKLTEEKKGWVVQNQTGYMTVDVYCTVDGMKVIFNDNTVEALQDVEALYVVGEQTTNWSRSSEVCQKLAKVEDGIYEGIVEIKRDNMLFDAARIITRPDNGDDDNHIGALNVGQQAIVGTRTLGTGSTGRMYLRKGENKITVNFNEGTITAEPINPEPSYMYAVGTLVDHVWQNTDTTYKLDEVEPNVFKGIVKVAEDEDSRFSLFCERTRDDWQDGRFGPIDESIKPVIGVATTNPISCSWDKAWRVRPGEWEVTLDLNNGSFLYDEYVPQADGILIDLATTTLDQWFTGPGEGNWSGESDSYATYDSKKGEVKVYINQDKDAQWKAQVKLRTTGIVLDPEKSYEFACNFESKNDLGGVTVKIFDNEQLFYNPSVALTAGANEYKTGAFAGGKTGNGVIVFDFGSAKAGDEITINGIKLYESEEPVVPDPQPETAPETPEIPEDALIIYADGKEINPAWGYCEGWGQSTNLTELDFEGNHVLYYKNFNYLGWGCASAVDASACNRLHIDFWAPEAGSIDLYPIFGGNGNATDDSKKATLNVEEGWNNIDIDLTTIEGLNLSSIFQFKFADGTMNVFAVDNVYFYNEKPFTIEVTANSEIISIVPSNEKDTWYYALLDETTAATWAMYGITANEDILLTMASIEELESDDELQTGSLITPTAESGLPDGNYVLIVAGAKFVDGEMVLTTEPVRAEFTVGEPEPEPEPATFEIAVDGTQVTITPSDEEATYAYVVINDAIMQELETTEVGQIFDILANGFNEVQTGTQTFDILEDYLEFIGIDELTPGEDITVAVAQVKRAENKLILRVGDLFTKTFKAPETDGINGIAADAKETIFNLAGQRQLTRQRGVNIINGKKLLVK